MIGYLRFILAFLVLISHVKIKILGLNPGVTAVVIFYLLAGHVVSHLWQDVLPRGRMRLFAFYRDRILRIMPLYLYITALTLIFLSLTHYGNPEFSFFKLAGNILVVPLNYYMVWDAAILKEPDGWLIPPAWSLGAELQAYALLPLVFRVKWMKILLAVVSFGVFMLANTCVINSDYFGYRLIFGVFFIFVAGSCIQKNRDDGKSRFLFDKIFPWVLWILIAFLFMTFYMEDLFCPSYTRETFLGILLGIPLIRILSQTKLKLPFNGLLGSISYGVFLSHFLVIRGLDHMGLTDRLQPLVYIPVITLGSSILAFLGIQYLEKYIDRIRK